ncbi:MAG: gliding motility-associated C-terminal domain-containing protein [Bacteroidetes bacterium]|nr:gliding motility-associated C-terminal domain-containing protein [Bacteroidota bacterium]
MSAVTSNVNCSGNSNGFINITAAGGTGPFVYVWSNGLTTEDLNGIIGGTYGITITDAHGCTVSASYTISEPNPIVSSVAGTNVTCNGSADGSADLTVSGGTQLYTFLWSTFQNTEDLTNLSGGIYRVIITDVNGCQIRDSIIITEPAAITISVATTNVLCNGDASGGVDITVNGGTPTITYAWSNGSNLEDLSGVVAGNYSVTITDGNGCTASATATVTQPAALVMNSTVTNVSCAGGANGSVDVTVQGGVFPYTYGWSNAATTEDIHNVSGGNYSVTITDANGCSLTASFTVSEPVAMTTSIIGTNVTCHGAANGAADLTVSDGTPPYTYLWSNFLNTQDLNNIGGGTFYVIVTDANGCTKRDSVIISEPTAIALSVSITNVLCNGATDGAIDLTVSGGSPGYGFSWSNLATSEDISGLTAGTYTVTVNDNNGCTTSISAIISQPAQALNTSVVVTDVSCNAGTNGSINLTVTGGTQPYSFVWSNGPTTEDISGLSAGTYTVSITDANGCLTTASAIVNEPAALTASITPTNVSCFGGNDGATDLTVSGGTSPYSYLWSTFATTEDLVSLTAGNYVVIVTDAKGCQKITTTTVTQPTQIVVSGVVTNLSCNNAGDGFIDLTVSGGTSGYTFVWSNQTSSEDQSNVVAGTYSVTVFDANLCTATATFTVTEPAALTVSGTTTDVNCNGGANGAINISVAGGTTPYSYSWSNGATTEDISGLSGGPYSVIVTDANLCSASAAFTIAEPAAITSTVVGTNVLCHGDSSGVADLTVSGGVTPYTFLWNTFDNTEDLTNLSGGVYRVIITDANGCTHRDSVIITEPAAITISVLTTNVLCNGDASGAVDVTVNGGTPTINYAWSNGATIEDLSGVAAGNYSVSITDGNGCTASATATVTQPAALVLNSNITNVACAGGANGSVDVTVQGGVFPYAYSWSNGASTEDIHNVSGGNYSVTILDANGCSLSASFTVSEPAALTASTTATDVSCHGANDGAVDLTVTGGVPAYTYFWTNGSTTEDLSGLAGGTYTVLVHDANGCSIVASQVVAEPTAIMATVVVTNVLCNGGNGSVDLTVTGGIGNYSFAWSNSTSSEDLVSVVAGTYTVTITDGNGCTATASATITQPTALLLTGNSTDVSCNGGSNGTINISISGGVVPYTFAWSNGTNTEDLTGLVAGTYTCTTTDGNGCAVTASFTIDEPTLITSTTAATDVTCHGAANGSAILIVNGGTPNYSFAWSNFQVSQNISNLAGGTYFVIITDANGCTHRDSVIIAEPSALVLSITATSISCNGGTADVDLTVSGGTLNYSYAWDNGASSEDLTGVAAGTYTVVVTDGNGCTASASATIIQPTALTLIGSATNVHCAGGNDGSVNISVGGGTTPYSYSWSNGPTSEDVQNLSQGTYSVTVNDINGCSVTATYTITEPTGINSTVTGTDVLCQGANNGTATLTVTGGILPYTFFWSNFQGSQNIANLDGGIYYVLITDANGCSHRDSVIINEPSPLIISVDSSSNISCFSNNDGAIYISVVGGTQNYSYLWSNGAITQDITGLNDAVYVVDVTDANGCTASHSVNIARPSLLTLNNVIQTPLCNADANGSIDLIPSGGTPSYSYEWKNSAGTVISIAEDISGIGAGVYAVIVTDVRGCKAYDTILVTEPGSFFISDFYRNPTCHGFSDGYVDVTAYGGTLPYGFTWNDGGTTEDLYNLQGDSTYRVTASDAHGCIAQFTQTLVNPAAIAVNATATDVSCFGGNDGTLTGSATGGVQPYRYFWSTFDTTESIANVMAGHYILQVTDSFGCYNSDTADVSQPTDISIAGTVTNEICFGGTTGAIDITVLGGTPTYTFAWTGGSTNEDLINAMAGNDTVMVTDSKGCAKTAVYSITQPTEIYLSLLSNEPSCNGSTNGSLSVVASQGVPGYTYVWSTVPAQTNASASNLTAGDYTVTVTDSKGCTVTATQTLSQPVAIVVDINATATKCSNTSDGKVIVTVTGGLAPYIYELNGLAQLTNTFTGVGAGNYLVIVSDANGCEGTDTFTISQPAAFTVTLSTQQNTILTGMQTQIFATVTPAQHILNYFWSPDSLFDFTQCDPAVCDNPFAAPRTTTTLMVLAMNSDSCYASDTITIYVNNEASKFIPTAFTPNGDGLNDRFEFDVLGAKKLDVTVYTRWGDVVYHNDNQVNGMNQNSGWDGTKDGKICPFDTYVYKIKITYFDDSLVDVTSTVTLMK